MSDDLTSNPGYVIKKGTKEAPLGDIFRVHDYNYLMKVIKLCESLKHNLDKNAIIRFGKPHIPNIIYRS
jgi:hypothetical protein